MNKIEPRIWKHTILQGDDEEKLRELRAAHQRAKAQSSDAPLTVGEVDPVAEAARVANEFADEAEKRGVTITMRAVGRKKWRELVEAHPPQEGDEEDRKAGVNLDAFAEALVPACIAGPTFSEGEMTDFLDALTPAQFDLLALAAWNLHKNLGADPKERLGSSPAPS